MLLAIVFSAKVPPRSLITEMSRSTRSERTLTICAGSERVTGEDNGERHEPERWGWFVEGADGRRSYYSDDPEFVADRENLEVAADSDRFHRLVLLDLEADERQMLIYGLRDWGGPAHGSDSLAAAMGFISLDGLVTEAQILISAIAHERALSIRDWTRALVATEFAFASAVLGTGLSDWGSINGLPAEHWINVLERLQSKLPTDSDALSGKDSETADPARARSEEGTRIRGCRRAGRARQAGSRVPMPVAVDHAAKGGGERRPLHLRRRRLPPSLTGLYWSCRLFTRYATMAPPPMITRKTSAMIR